MFIIDEIPTEIWTEVAMQLLDARDLVAVDRAVGYWTPIASGATFVARRVLSLSELDWFAARTVPVTLLAETAHTLNRRDVCRICEWQSGASVDLGGGGGGAKVWKLNGAPHRDNDLPAVEWDNGDRIWCVRGEVHRENDQPAIVRVHGLCREWWRWGVRHRLDLPALIWTNIESDIIPTTDREWWVDGNRHRENDLPAIHWSTGDQKWYLGGLCHRAGDLPAVERANGDREWHADGKLHRENGLPAVERANGDRLWYARGQLHRDGDFPAIEWGNSGTRIWYVHGKRHRERDLPAIMRPNGCHEWWVDGKQVGTRRSPRLQEAAAASPV